MEPNPIKILIADDEPDIVEIISFHLNKAGYEVATAKDGSEAIEKAKVFNPDCIVLDVMMPKRNGFEVCEYLRSDRQFDNFINKPISPKVLISRISALFRRIQPATTESKTLQIKDLVIDAEQYKTILNGVVHVLAKKEFELLYLLAAQPGRVFLRNEILSQVWGNDVIVGDRTIDVHIRKIRVKLGIDCITTVKGVGYKFDY